MATQHPQSVRAELNFALPGGGIGEWSNLNPQRTRQNMQSVAVEIRNGRNHPVQPTLDNEGLTIVQHPVGNADWLDNG